MLDYLHANTINVASSKYRSACLKFQISVHSLVGPSKIDYTYYKGADLASEHHLNVDMDST